MSELQEIQVRKETIAAALLFVSKDNTREALTGVRFESGRIIATNSYVACRIATGESGMFTGDGFTLASNWLSVALKNAEKGSLLTIPVPDGCDVSKVQVLAHAKGMDIETPVSVLKSAYPVYLDEKQFDAKTRDLETDPEKPVVALGAGFLATIAKAGTILTPPTPKYGQPRNGMHVFVESDSKPVHWEIDTVDDMRAEMLQMPVRLS